MKISHLLIVLAGIFFPAILSAQSTDGLKKDSSHVNGKFLRDSAEFSIYQDQTGAIVRIPRTDIQKKKTTSDSGETKITKAAQVLTLGGLEFNGDVVQETSDALVLMTKDSSKIDIPWKNIRK